MKLIAKIIIIVAIFFAGFYFGQNQALAPTKSFLPFDLNNNDSIPVKPEEIKVNLMFDFGTGEVKTFNQVSLAQGATIFDLLKKVTAENNIKFEYQDYGQKLGIFVKSINGVGDSSSGNKFWQYWVNNQYAQIGASGYQLKNGDLVEWKYIKGQIN